MMRRESRLIVAARVPGRNSIVNSNGDVTTVSLWILISGSGYGPARRSLGLGLYGSSRRAASSFLINSNASAGIIMPTNTNPITEPIHSRRRYDVKVIAMHPSSSSPEVPATSNYIRVERVSVSNSLSGRGWELDQVPAVGNPTHIVQIGRGHRLSTAEGQRRVRLEQRIMIGAEMLRCAPTTNGSVEHATDVDAIDRATLHADSDQATRELVHDHEDPVAPEHDGLASKEVHAPQAVCGVSDERQPRRPGSARH